MQAVTIEELCSNWRKSIQYGDEIRFHNQEKKHELSQNGIEPHLLSFNELATLGSEIGKNILFAKDSSYIGTDHYLFWTWCSAIILDGLPSPIPNKLYNDPTLKSLFETCISSMLTTTPGFYEGLALGKPSYTILSNSNQICSYIGFPLLESLSRFLAADYLTMDGEVIQPFTIPKTDKHPEKEYKKGRCNRLKDSLYLATTKITNDHLREKTASLIRSLDKFSDDNDNGYEYLYELRNSAMHAGVSQQALAGTLITIASLLALSLVEAQYDRLAQWSRINSKFKRHQQDLTNSWCSLYSKLYSIEICCEYSWYCLDWPVEGQGG